MPLRIINVLVALSMDTDGGLACSAIDSIAVTVSSGTDSWRFQPEPHSEIKAMIAVEFYRRLGPDDRSVWKMRTVGQGWAGGLAELARNHGIDVD